MAGDLNRPAVGVLLPGRLAAALQACAAAHEADRTASVRAEGGLAARGHRAREVALVGGAGFRGRRRAGGFWGFAHPFQNS